MSNIHGFHNLPNRFVTEHNDQALEKLITENNKLIERLNGLTESYQQDLREIQINLIMVIVGLAIALRIFF